MNLSHKVRPPLLPRRIVSSLGIWNGGLPIIISIGGMSDDAADDIADFEDSTIVSLKFANGAIGTVISTSCTEVPEGCGWELTGRDFYLKLTMDLDLSGVIDGKAVSYRGEETGYIRQVGEFLTALKTKNQAMIKSSYADAVTSLQLTMAAERSLQSGGQTIRLES